MLQPKKELEKKLAESRTEYDQAYLEVQPYINKVAEDIINLFAQKRWPQFKPGFPGQRLRLQGAMDWEARNDYGRLFERREREEDGVLVARADRATVGRRGT